MVDGREEGGRRGGGLLCGQAVKLIFLYSVCIEGGRRRRRKTTAAAFVGETVKGKFCKGFYALLILLYVSRRPGDRSFSALHSGGPRFGAGNWVQASQGGQDDHFNGHSRPWM